MVEEKVYGEYGRKKLLMYADSFRDLADSFSMAEGMSSDDDSGVEDKTPAVQEQNIARFEIVGLILIHHMPSARADEYNRMEGHSMHAVLIGCG